MNEQYDNQLVAKKNLWFGRAVAIGLFLALWGGCYFFGANTDCIRMRIDGSVRCPCDFPTKDAWNDFKENSRGTQSDGWEPVTMKSNPCKK